MPQASVCDSCTLDAFSLGQDCLGPAEVDVGRGQIVDALMIADVVVVFDEGVNLPFEIAGQVVVVEQNAADQLPLWGPLRTQISHCAESEKWQLRTLLFRLSKVATQPQFAVISVTR